MTGVLRKLSIYLVLGIGLTIAHPAWAGTKALLIGSNYTEAPNEALRLANPITDIRMVGEAMKRTAIDEVTLLEEPNADDWQAAMDSFVNSMSGDDIAVLYVAAHGFQVDGINYFLSSDSTALIALDPLLERLTARAKGVVVIVDACRNNPISTLDDGEDISVVEITDGSRGLQPITLLDLAQARDGLAQLGNLRGLSAVVFFSTEPGNVAEDGDTPGKGSPFAKVFAREITRRQSLDETFRRTAVKVNDATQGRQSPWRQGDLPFNVFIAGMRALPIP
jgi:uncharacterized caspase-like protein